MAQRFVVFDVETPNWANDRMSAIGVTVVEGGRIVDELSTLVDPEVHFDPFNIQLTGITPEMAAQAPKFVQLWPKLEHIFGDSLLIAHNAPFDMSVLSKCLRAYGIPWRSTAYYACTCQMGRRCYPELADHRLNTMCAYLGIALDHHQAASDSRACAGLLMDYLRRGVDVEQFRRRYDMVNGRTASGRQRCQAI